MIGQGLATFWLNAPVIIRHFRPGDNWSIHSKRRQVIFWAQVGYQIKLPSFMQKPTEKSTEKLTAWSHDQYTCSKYMVTWPPPDLGWTQRTIWLVVAVSTALLGMTLTNGMSFRIPMAHQACLLLALASKTSWCWEHWPRTDWDVTHQTRSTHL